MSRIEEDNQDEDDFDIDLDLSQIGDPRTEDLFDGLDESMPRRIPAGFLKSKTYPLDNFLSRVKEAFSLFEVDLYLQRRETYHRDASIETIESIFTKESLSIGIDFLTLGFRAREPDKMHYYSFALYKFAVRPAGPSFETLSCNVQESAYTTWETEISKEKRPDEAWFK